MRDLGEVTAETSVIVARSAPEVLCIGESMVLLAPADGKRLEEALSCSISFAGAESTVSQYLAELGCQVGWVSRVGDDPFGRRIVASLSGRGVGTSLVEFDPSRPTGTYFKDPGPGATTVYYYRRGSAAAAMGPEFADHLPIERARLLHLCGITAALSQSCRGLVERLFERARAAGVMVSFDVNYRPGLWGVVEAAVPLADFARRADVVFVGRDEAQELWWTGSAESVAQYLGSKGLVVVKDAGVGATEFGDSATFVAAPAVDVVEPVGAGDAFAAGYLAKLLDGKPATARLAEGHRLAARALRSYEDFVPEEGG